MTINLRTTLQNSIKSALLLSLVLCGTGVLAQLPGNLTQDQAQALLQGNNQAEVQAQLQESAGAGTAARDVNESAVIAGIEANAQQVQGPELLPEGVVDSTTAEPLRQFGYELFAGAPTTFAPATNIPVPLNYVIGPNDTVIIQLYGQRNVRYELVVTREGVLQFPEIGPLNVAGLTFEEAQELLQTTVSTSLIGQQVSITMGALRSIQIFVLGEAFRPGSYTVSSLSTMTNALFSSGGVTRVGSLRDIRLMRQGALITSLDLYDLLLRGDTSGDVRLQPNDVIFIPPIGRTMGIAGEVKRPAIFELKAEQTLREVMPLSGGYLPTAFPSASRIERINNLGERTLVDIDLNDSANLENEVRDGDVLQVYSILDQIEGVVLLEGHVNRPGGFTWRQGLRVTDILANIGDMLPNPDLDFALIAREQQPTRRIEVVYVNLRQALANPTSAFDLQFQPRDRLIVFGARQNRQEQLAGLISTLRQQATFESIATVVNVQGSVMYPGDYPLTTNMQVNDLLRFAGGLQENSELDYLMLERKVDNQGRIATQSISLNTATLETDFAIDLRAGDGLHVFGARQSRQAQLADLIATLRQQATFEEPATVVTVQGSVMYPGDYPLMANMQVDDLIQFAGGLQENSELDYLLLERNEDNQGRIAVQSITLDKATLQTNSAVDLRAGDGLYVFNALQARDELLTPVLERLRSQATSLEQSKVVTVTGNVRYPGEYPLVGDLDVGKLIDMAGGLTESAESREAEISRYRIDSVEGRELEHLEVSLTSDGSAGLGARLQPFDQLVVRQLANWTETETVTIGGEVRSPGVYTISKEESISQLIARAGGLTEFADPKASIFLREELRESEQALLAEFTQRLSQDLLIRSVRTTSPELQPTQIDGGVMDRLLDMVNEAQATGRLVINMNNILREPEGPADVILRDGDQLLIPRTRQEITVIGEVQRPTSHFFDEQLTVANYIEKSGGFSSNADKNNVFLVKSSGDIVSLSGSRWFFQQGRDAIEPGDSLIVPFDANLTDTLYTWTGITRILFNLATTVLAINSVQN